MFAVTGRISRPKVALMRGPDGAADFQWAKGGKEMLLVSLDVKHIGEAVGQRKLVRARPFATVDLLAMLIVSGKDRPDHEADRSVRHSSDNARHQRLPQG
jgi:hypothetical protein